MFRRIKDEQSRSFGRFINFPSIIHGTVEISHKTSIKRLKHIVAEALRSLNGITMSRTLSVASPTGVQRGVMIFEIGVADGFNFDYLDEETLKKLSDIPERGLSSVLDILIIVSYYYFKNRRRIPLRFDHILFRFVFNSRELNIYLHHVKGIRRLPLDELLKQIIATIKNEMKKNQLKTFNIEYLKTF